MTKDTFLQTIGDSDFISPDLFKVTLSTYQRKIFIISLKIQKVENVVEVNLYVQEALSILIQQVFYEKWTRLLGHTVLMMSEDGYDIKCL